MKILTFLILILSFNSFALTDKEAIKNCLSKFDSHPFDKKNPKFKTLKPATKVLNSGPVLIDTERSDEVELVLIQKGVSVIAKPIYKLLNPNAWYCMKNKVSVISKTVIELDCNARFATSSEAVTIIGDDPEANGGITVIGSNEIHRKNCKKKSPATKKI